MTLQNPYKMAKTVEFKQFLIIECTAKELRNATGSPLVMCDWCGDIALANNYKGYYIAVLNQWYCKECFEKWKESAEYYIEDADVERRNFEFYAPLLGINVSKS